MLLDDVSERPAAAPRDDAGWAELMRIAADFPLEALSFGRPASAAVPTPTALVPRQVSYEQAINLVDGGGDGPSIGLGTGLAVAVR